MNASHPENEVQTGVDNLERGSRFSSPAAQLRLSIQEARSWKELESLCVCIDATYRSGGLDLQAAEELADLTAQMARITPETGPGDESVWVNELLEPQSEIGERCPCCGKSVWWNKEGKAVCGVCHPNPGWKTGKRHAA